MALLLAMYQKMRLIREKNQLVLEQTQYSSKLSRIEKNIERQQKRFTSLFAQLESQAKMMQNNATMWFQSSVGLGVNSVNPMNYTGVNAFVANGTKSLSCDQGYKYQTGGDASNPTWGLHKIDPNKFQTMWAHYMQNGKFVPVTEKAADGTLTPKTQKSTVPGRTDKDEYVYDGFTALDVEAFMAAMNGAQMQQQQAQMWVQNATQQYGTNVSIWLEAQKAQLEAEQDAVLEPLNYQQTMLELEKTQKDARLKRIETELQSYTELASKEAESTAPSFGLR